MSEHLEFGAFRKGDTSQQTPLENFTFRSRWQAEKWLKAHFSQPDYWEIRSRVVGEWGTSDA